MKRGLLLFFLMFGVLTFSACGTQETEYTITFEVDSDTVLEEENSVSYEEGVDLALPTPSKEGYVFDGWFKDTNYEEPLESESMPDNDLTLHAKFIPIDDDNDEYYALTFDVDDETSLDNEHIMMLKQGEAVTLPTPQKDGYAFDGWFMDESLDSAFEYETMIERDITLYPKFILYEDIIDIALITDVGDVDDSNYNEAAWKGVEAYGDENDIPYDYFRPHEESDSAYINKIETAIYKGAEIIITPGSLFERSVYEMQNKHPDVTFVLLDGNPRNEMGNIAVEDNTVSVFYAEEQAGFLAGYATVKDGHTDLGFMGGLAIPGVVHYGIGYIAGAYYAAEEDSLELSFTDDRFTYLETFVPDDNVLSQAESWFNDGTEVIFSASKGADSAVMSAAENYDSWVIVEDVDQSSRSTSVLTSATKHLSNSVYLMLERYYSNDFPGGETLRLDASDNGVALPMDTSRFDTFDSSDYDTIYTALKDGDIVVPSTYEALTTFFETHDLDSNALNPDNQESHGGITQETIE